MSWSRGSDSFTHPVTNYVTNQIVWNHPPGSDPDWDSFSWTREVSELDRDPELRWSRGSDSFTPPGHQLCYESDSLEPSTRLIFGLGFILMDPRSESTRPRSRTELVTRLRVVHPPGNQLCYESDSLEPSTRLIFGLGFILTDPRSESTRPRSRTELVTRLRLVHPPGHQICYESDSLETSTRLKSGLGFILMDPRNWNPPPSLNPNWDSSLWTQEVSELDRDPELTRSRGSNSFTHPGWNPPPGSYPDWNSSSWTREVSQLDRDPPQILPCGEMDWVERWMKHYSSFQKILLVGEGDFSFSACLAVAFGCAHNIIATSLDSGGKTNKDSAS
ncbi:methyltransferase small domain protein, putative [Actinidia rufa]|uniref:Methyltransferase small domain protein, putative n=1 Tax=Actinidia rufa TaxID=165716 RepID=A0A7J0F5G4_9ERIC|nr:methyltransferase small domain protein, putative [Actinidia rufa]